MGWWYLWWFGGIFGICGGLVVSGVFGGVCGGLVVSVGGLAILFFLWVCYYLWCLGGIGDVLVVFVMV